jgi:hypothetical protein
VQGTFPLFLFLYVEQRENFVGMYAFLFLGEQREVNEYMKRSRVALYFLSPFAAAVEQLKLLLVNFFAGVASSAPSLQHSGSNNVNCLSCV